jgi:hypothetical protein
VQGKGIEADCFIFEDKGTVILQNVSSTALHLRRPVYMQNENVIG